MKKYLTLSLILGLTIFTAACNEENKPVIDSSNVAIPVDAQKRFGADKIGNLIAESAAGLSRWSGKFFLICKSSCSQRLSLTASLNQADSKGKFFKILSDNQISR